MSIASLSDVPQRTFTVEFRQNHGESLQTMIHGNPAVPAQKGPVGQGRGGSKKPGNRPV